MPGAGNNAGERVGYNVGFLGSSLTCFGGQVHLKVEGSHV